MMSEDRRCMIDAADECQGATARAELVTALLFAAECLEAGSKDSYFSEGERARMKLQSDKFFSQAREASSARSWGPDLN